MRRNSHKNNRKQRRNHKKQGLFEILKRYLDILAG